MNDQNATNEDLAQVSEQILAEKAAKLDPSTEAGANRINQECW